MYRSEPTLGSAFAEIIYNGPYDRRRETRFFSRVEAEL